ncbi:mannonate dehydratase [Hoeflea prorocentri]|uniref:Mannonate dehydratase n=1 Tax=Hoeflea prorocentri TaxID=1922333 RepID=A0A9X3UJB8_9HYPH|nr:mannonate dehydratase [Hoeflea prorocentri]MCY6379791.1 mannonate dehydratase [Hoeflea prorocentri]MDA5397591.1 mannonate dehydratase [Hoeflea prorocentri]
MRQTWRWFGPADTISIDQLAQIGVEGVVSALHHVETGAVWPSDEIAKRQREIATTADGRPTGLEWEVVESLPVSETIKTAGPGWENHIDNYRVSLENLAAAGLKTICYNFMPVLDWTRTHLRWPLANGGTAMRFDLAEFAAFDIYLLGRQGAADDYPSQVRDLAEKRHSEMSAQEKTTIERNIVAGLPGANDEWSLEEIRSLLGVYADIDHNVLRQNLVAFLEAVVPTAERLGLRLCCHPDDPPFPILGLPRIMSTVEDYAHIMEAVDSPANGITLCTGSMGVAENVDFVSFIRKWGHRVRFVHLRNTTRSGVSFDNKHSFFEDAHLDGDTDMVAVIAALLSEEERRRAKGQADAVIPMRPDHGQELLDDLKRDSMPGYPLVGRMRGLAELRGIMTALSSQHLKG